jgi:outer membrane protein
MQTIRLLLGATALATCQILNCHAADLKSVLETVEKTNPDIFVKSAVADQAEARLDEARAGYYPTLSANGAVERRKLVVGSAEADTSTFTAKSVGIEAKLPVFRGFQTQNSTRIRKAELDSANATQKGTEQSVLFDATNAYVLVSRDRRITQINQSQVDLIREQVKGTQTRLARGEATRTDVSQAEARLAVAIAGRAAAQESLEISESQYRRAIGQSPETLAPLPTINNFPASLDEAQTLALNESPALVAAKANEVAAEKGIGFAKGYLYPDVDVVAGVDYLSGGVSNLFTGALPNDRKAYFGGVQAKMPLFQGGSEYARIRGAKAFLNQRKAERLTAERRVADDVAQSWVQLNGARSIIEATRTAVNASEKAADGVRREAIGGNRTVLDVLDAQNELLNARTAYERAVHSEYVARAAVMANIGRLSAKNLGAAQ